MKPAWCNHWCKQSRCKSIYSVSMLQLFFPYLFTFFRPNRKDDVFLCELVQNEHQTNTHAHTHIHYPRTHTVTLSPRGSVCYKGIPACISLSALQHTQLEIKKSIISLCVCVCVHWPGSWRQPSSWHRRSETVRSYVSYIQLTAEIRRHRRKTMKPPRVASAGGRG